MYKIFVLAAIVACATATPGYPALSYGAVSPAIGSTAQSVSRSYDGGASISQYSKAVDTAFSSVRKYDTRITNDARYLAPVATYAHAPAVATYAHAPAVATYAHAPAVATYASAPVVSRAYAPAIAAPVVAARAYGPAIAAPVAHAGLLGVAYSAAPAVSHISFDGFGAHYGW